MNTMSVKEFVELGYLQEVNRLLLHRQGVALGVTVDGDKYTVGPIFDGRKDPEGIVFECPTDASKAHALRFARNIRDSQRMKALGWTIQPVTVGGDRVEAIDPALPQPQPELDPLSSGVEILPLVLFDLKKRAEAGKVKYGTALKTNNGRNCLIDAYQEALDLCMYLRQAIEEQGGAESVR